MAGAKSKNSRTATTPGQQKAQLSGDMRLIISCNGGKNAYVLNLATGTNPNMATDSEAFVETIRVNSSEGLGARQRAEIDRLAQTSPVWAETLGRLDAAGAFA